MNLSIRLTHVITFQSNLWFDPADDNGIMPLPVTLSGHYGAGGPALSTVAVARHRRIASSLTAHWLLAFSNLIGHF